MSSLGQPKYLPGGAKDSCLWQLHHPCAPGVAVAVADYVSTCTRSSLALEHPLKNLILTLANEISHEKFGWPPIMSATCCSCYIQCLGCRTKYSNMQNCSAACAIGGGGDCYTGIPKKRCTHLPIWASISTVLTVQGSLHSCLKGKKLTVSWHTPNRVNIK